MTGGSYCHCWICCLNCWQGQRGCRLSFCCCCIQTGDPRGEESSYSRKTTDLNLCGCCGMHGYDHTAYVSQAGGPGAAPVTTAPQAQQMNYGNTGYGNTAQTVPAGGQPVAYK